MCSMEAPDVFTVAKHGTVEVLMATVPERLRDDVEAAVKYCPPTRALSIVDD